MTDLRADLDNIQEVDLNVVKGKIDDLVGILASYATSSGHIKKVVAWTHI